MKQSFGQWLTKAYRCLCLVLLGGVLLHLMLLSLFSTSHVLYGERVFFVSDSPLPILAAFALLCFACVKWRMQLGQVAKVLAKRRAKAIVLAVAGILGVAWVLCARSQPVADQRMLVQVAADMRAGEFAQFAPGGYMDMLPHQTGMVLFLYLLSFPFGAGNFLAIQLLNVAALLLCYTLLYRINTLSGASPAREGVVLVASVLFLPVMLYTTFVYGNLIGLAFALGGLWQALLLLQNGRWRHAAAATALMAVGCVVKGNYLVLLAAVVVLLLFTALTKRQWKPLVCALLFIAGYLLLNAAAIQLTAAITGIRPAGGLPAYTWVAMGLQESPRAPGWYNSYPEEIYIGNRFDGAAAGQVALQNIRGRLSEFAATPFYALEFFGKKTASQWNDASFGGLWVAGNAVEGFERPGWVLSLLYGRGNLALVWALNLLQSLLLLGALCWVTLHRGKPSPKRLLLALAFLGGFVFYLAWEAKGQYTLPFFFLLLPYAAEGYACLTARLVSLLGVLKPLPVAAKIKRGAKARVTVLLAGLMVCVALLGFTNRRVLDVTLKPADDSGEYAAIQQGYRDYKA